MRIVGGGSRTSNLGGQIVLSAVILFILALGLMVQNQLYSFLKTRNRRHVNKIIIFNFIIQNITIPIILCYFFFAIWIRNPSQYISDYGCYGIGFVTEFMFIFDRSTSFFINLFRYICILHDAQLKKYDIHPKVKYKLGLFGMLKLALALQFIITNAYFSVACNTKVSVHNNELQH